MNASATPALAPLDVVDRLRTDAPLYTATGLLLAFLVAPTATAALLDTRAIDGIGVWAKPLKFELALAAYAFSLAFFARYVPGPVRARRAWRTMEAAASTAIVLEIAWLVAAASLGERAHFNASHPVLMPLYPVMGILATVLTSATAMFAWAIHRHERGLPPVLRAGLVWGLGLTLPLTIVTAFWLSNGTGHHIAADMAGASLLGAPGDDRGGLWLFGWSRDGGDLRVAHFLATHAMHAVPLLALAAWWMGRTGAGPARLAALGWTALVAAAFAQALAGRPFLPLIG